MRGIGSATVVLFAASWMGAPTPVTSAATRSVTVDAFSAWTDAGVDIEAGTVP